jgi:hypothetical protein
MPRPKVEETGALIKALAALPQEESWDLLRRLKPAPGCELVGGWALTASELEKLVALHEGLANALFWAAGIAAAKAYPIESGDAAFI